jgi:DNA-binding transcriptional regulator YdaS (Cro superfamily)
MSTEITPEARRRLASATGVSEQYLYQCLTGRRDMNPAEARRLEDVTGGELRRWMLCQKTWFAIWPELIGTDGAPATPEPAEAGRC